MTSITLLFERLHPSFDDRGGHFSGVASYCYIQPTCDHDPDASVIRNVWFALSPWTNVLEAYRTDIANLGRQPSERLEKIADRLAASEATMYCANDGDFIVHYCPKRASEAFQFLMALSLAGQGVSVRLETGFSISRDNPHSDDVSPYEWTNELEPLLCSRLALFPWNIEKDGVPPRFRGIGDRA